MATNKNITMKQFNGTDYDTLYPKTDVKQIENLTPSSIGAVAKSGDTMTGDLYFPNGKKLWFYTAGTVGYYLQKKDANFLGIYDQDGHLLLGFNYNGKPVAFGGNRIVTADEMVGVPKIAIGSYVGTGVAGSADGTSSLTFNFEPKIVFVMANGANGLYPGTAFIRGQSWSGGLGELPREPGKMQNIVSWSGNTVTWYSNGGYDYPQAQMNAAGMTYFYCALG